MIYAKLFSTIPIETRFVDRFTDGSQLIYQKTSKGSAMLMRIKSENQALLSLHRVGERRRISHNDAFPLLVDVLRELPERIDEEKEK